MFHAAACYAPPVRSIFNPTAVNYDYALFVAVCLVLSVGNDKIVVRKTHDSRVGFRWHMENHNHRGGGGGGILHIASRLTAYGLIRVVMGDQESQRKSAVSFRELLNRGCVCFLRERRRSINLA